MKKCNSTEMIAIIFIYLSSVFTTITSIDHFVPLDQNSTTEQHQNVIYSILNPINNCPTNLLHSEVTGKCEDLDTYDRIKKRDSCKNITLTQNSYKVTQNGNLQIILNDMTFPLDKYKLQNDSTVKLCFPLTPLFRACKRWVIFPDEFTLENDGLTLVMGEEMFNTGEFIITETESAHVCVRNSSTGEIRSNTITALYSTCYIISLISIFISLVIYIIINFGKMKYQIVTLICHMISLFVFYLLLTIRDWRNAPSEDFCVYFNFFIHYFFLSSFFWLNVLAFDIWQNLPRFGAVHTKKNRRIFLACLYAWGVPIVIASCSLIFNQYGPKHSPFRPKFESQCWFFDIESKIVFLYGPAAIIIMTNVVFFIMTVVRLRRLGQDARRVNKKIHKQLLRMYVKLMVVMGLCWIMEIVSGIVDKDDRYWYFTDVINGLQGFFLFLVYVCKASVARDLADLWLKHMPIGHSFCKKFARTNPGRFSSPSRGTSNFQASSVSVISNSVTPPNGHVRK